ncbi:MAG: glycoside hydrolase family 3 C-terminal domain-containing protein, partial [Muribaculaceae bacterium]|nr:glycoside hydrolase family 3 C-terminal domain-containing protein [Muribaculaceae bacterium]
EITPLEGLRNRFGKDIEITYSRGYVGDTTTYYNGLVTGQNLADSRTPEELRAEAVKAAREADMVIFIGGLNKSDHQDAEDSDRYSMELPYGQDALISALREANPNMVVVNISGTGVAMPWANKVPGIIQAWYLGNETGNALASVISGDTNPSGKLPYTYYASLDQVGAHKMGEYPGHPSIDNLGNEVMDMPYNEGIFVGYRFTDKNKLRPTFPFGHGLSYTDFAYGDVFVPKVMKKDASAIEVTVPVTNTGDRKCKEIIQLYVRDIKSSVERPVKELKGFSKVELEPGQTEQVTFNLGRDAFSYFDADRHEWVMEPGDFEILVGTSAGDIRSKATFRAE